MSEHDLMVLRMISGTIVSGLSLVFFAYGLGVIYRNWGWWNL